MTTHPAGHRRHRHQRPSKAGFSLLEVMVAVAILGLGLTAILSAQAGAFSAATHARSLSLATGLARCKMMEVEEKLVKDGFPELDENDSGPCCDDDDREAMRCTWRIERPELPEPKLGELDLGADLNLSGDPGGAPGAGAGALAALAGGVGAPPLGSDAKVGDIAQGFAGSIAETGGVDGLAGMAMSMVYPDLKKYFEAGTRRLTVTVHWADGSQDRTLEVMQWYTKAVAPAANPTATATSTSTTPPPSR